VSQKAKFRSRSRYGFELVASAPGCPPPGVVSLTSTSLSSASAREADSRCTHRCRPSALLAPPEMFANGRRTAAKIAGPPNKALLHLGGSRPRCLGKNRIGARRPNSDDHRNQPGHPAGIGTQPNRCDLCRVEWQALRPLQLDRRGARGLQLSGVIVPPAPGTGTLAALGVATRAATAIESSRRRRAAASNYASATVFRNRLS